MKGYISSTFFIPNNNPFKQYGDPKKIAKTYFGGKKGLLDAMDGLQKEIYA